MNDLLPFKELLHLRCRSRYRRRPAAQNFGFLVKKQLAAVDYENVFEQLAHFVYQMGRQDDRSRVLGIILQQPVVEQASGYGIQT